MGEKRGSFEGMYTLIQKHHPEREKIRGREKRREKKIERKRGVRENEIGGGRGGRGERGKKGGEEYLINGTRLSLH